MQFKPAVTALVAAISLISLFSGCKKEEAVPALQTPQVGVVTLKTQVFTLTTDLPGRTTSYRSAEVRPQVNGIILKRLFKEGSDVKVGQQLYQIDPIIYESNVLGAKATLQSARSLAGRYKKLVTEQAVSRQEYDNAEAACFEAEAALNTAQVNLRYTKVLAPLTGHIGRSLYTEGALVTSSQANALAVITTLDPIYVDVTQSAVEMLELHRDLASGRFKKAGENAAKVKLSLPDGSEYPQEGRLEFSEVSVDETTGSVTLRAMFPNHDDTLLPGMFVHASLETGIDSNAILAPQIGVTHNLKGQPTAMIVGPDNKVQLRVLQASRTVGSNWLVEKGLNSGDRVIVDGLQFIKPGVEVKVIEAPAPDLATKKDVGSKGE